MKKCLSLSFQASRFESDFFPYLVQQRVASKRGLLTICNDEKEFWRNNSTQLPFLHNIHSVNMMSERGTDWKDFKNVVGYLMRPSPNVLEVFGDPRTSLGRAGRFVALEIIRMDFTDWRTMREMGGVGVSPRNTRNRLPDSFGWNVRYT